MTRTIAVVNHKGGSTKTTSTVNLAQALVEAGYTVRVVDLDPQCNATTWLGATPEAVDNDVLSVLMLVASIEEATTITASGIHLVPATKELDSVGPYFLKKPGAHGILRKALAGAPDVDFNLLDCPGDFDHLTISALVACTEVLAAVMTGAMELEALMRIENYITQQVELLNPTARSITFCAAASNSARSSTSRSSPRSARPTPTRRCAPSSRSPSVSAKATAPKNPSSGGHRPPPHHAPTATPPENSSKGCPDDRDT